MSKYFGLTHRQRKEMKRKERERKEYDLQFKKDLDDVYAMECSRSRRNAWKVASYMANKERQ